MTDKRDPAPKPGRVRQVLRQVGGLTGSTYRLGKSFTPLGRLLASSDDVDSGQLSDALDQIFAGLYQHPILAQSTKLTDSLRSRGLIPNEESTEKLIRFAVDQTLQRSPVPVPDVLVQEFWNFFDELFKAPELRGLGELSLDMVRLVLKTYEPLLTEVINLLKAGRRFNEWQLRELLRRAGTVRNDVGIIQRQLRALRYIKPFFEADPKDFKAQAQIVAQMVREFGPFFIKMAQVAAANADFLPEEIARELAVFHEDVPPMNEAEVRQAFMECYGKPPERLYLDFDAANPIKSGSIGSVFVAKKPFLEDGKEVLRKVVVKVGRHNIDREFALGKLTIGLAIISSQYWAPHSKLAPFLRALQGQVDEFVAGFLDELDFEAEAEHHRRFLQRSLNSSVWRVPALYSQSRRILEMEFLDSAQSLTRALEHMPPRARRGFQRRLMNRLLYTVLHHVLMYGEMHGDLHPGNVMVGDDGSLNLIDWGNVVPLEGKWAVVWDYLAGCILADTGLLTDALIRVSTDPTHHGARRSEIKQLLDDTITKRGITPLNRRNFLQILRAEGLEGLVRRGQTLMHLMSNSQQAGLVLHKDYLHLSRAIFAAAGSFGSLYEGESKQLLFKDLALSVASLPLTVTGDVFHHEIRQLRRWMARTLPLPMVLRARLAGQSERLPWQHRTLPQQAPKRLESLG